MKQNELKNYKDLHENLHKESYLTCIGVYPATDDT